MQWQRHKTLPYSFMQEGRGVQVRGQYVANCHVAKSSRKARDPAIASRLWDVSCKLAGVNTSEQLA